MPLMALFTPALTATIYSTRRSTSKSNISAVIKKHTRVHIQIKCLTFENLMKAVQVSNGGSVITQ